MDTIRVLHVVGILDKGGLETFILNLYRSIDRNKVQFDFLVHKKKKGAFEDEIESLGGRIYRIPYVNDVGPIGYRRELRKFFNNHKEYNIVHSHMNAVSGVILNEAKKCGVKSRIAHSHTSNPEYSLLEGIYKTIAKKYINKSANFKFACSEKAGKWLYGNDETFKVINNAIDIDNFKYDADIREAIRKEMNIKEKIVIGHVGRFCQCKNHRMIIDIFKEINKNYNNAILVLVGDGELKSYIKSKVDEYKLNDKVYFFGVRDDVNKVINSFDVMLFPSLHEGLPVTLIEAQANGLPCVISDSITKEVDLHCGLIKFVSLSDKISCWVRDIINSSNLREINNQDNIAKNIQKFGYNIKDIANYMERFYLENS